MTRVLITGAAGFLGRRLTTALLKRGTLSGRDGRQAPITELLLADLHAPELAAETGIPVTVRCGDLGDAAYVDALVAEGFDSLFHLGSLLTLEAETDPERAFRVNVEALRRLIEGARNCPRLVFTSSIAIHGGDLPERVDDDRNPLPATTYGTHKAINELLIADYSRHGRIDGRSLRLPIVLTRPGAPVPAVSDMVAGIIREPLEGIDVAVPIAAETSVPIVSAGAVVRGLIAMHDLPAAELPAKRAFNLPSLTVTAGDLAAAVRRHGATGTVTHRPDPKVQTIVEGWPRHFVSERAERLGILPDASLDALIADHLDDADV